MATFVGVMHKEKDSLFGVSFPDLPGVVAAEATMDSALRSARDVLEIALDELEAEEVPTPSTLDSLVAAGALDSGTAVLVQASPATKSVRLNITMDEGLLQQVDAAAAETGNTRSGLLADAARRMLRGRG